MTRLNVYATPAARLFPPSCTEWPTRMPRSYARIAGRSLTASRRRPPRPLRERDPSRKLSSAYLALSGPSLLASLFVSRLATAKQCRRPCGRPLVVLDSRASLPAAVQPQDRQRTQDCRGCWSPRAGDRV